MTQQHETWSPTPARAAGTDDQGVDGDLRRLLLTNDEAASILNISRTTLYHLVWSGRLTPVHIGRAVRFTHEELRAFVVSLSASS